LFKTLNNQDFVLVLLKELSQFVALGKNFIVKRFVHALVRSLDAQHGLCWWIYWRKMSNSNCRRCGMASCANL